MMDEDITLSYIQSRLEDKQYTLLFPALHQFIEELESRKLHGCQLLGLVDKQLVSGVPIVQRAMNILRFKLHKVLYKQLSPWLLQGHLADPYQEFFVHKVRKTKSLTSAGNQDEELGIGGISGKQLLHIQGASQENKDKKDGAYFEQFSLRGDMLPPYLSIRVLHKIVFIGESVDMFENNDSIDVKSTILKDKAMEYSRYLHQLSEAKTFSVLELENAVDTIRKCVTERLWEYVVQESKLKEQLFRIKDIFLLGRSDLYLSLIDGADRLLSCPPNPMTTNDINRIFQQVVRSLNMNDEKLQSFKLLVSSVRADGTKAKENGWTILSIQYKAEWPLHVFFTTVALERYNVIFKFLLAVKKTQVALHKAWKEQMCRGKKLALGKEEAWLHQIRNHMQFLVDNLQMYLQLDVIESQHQEMLDRIDNSKDFEIIRSAHETFQTNLLSQCFLLNVPVNHCLMCILESCNSFCTILRSCDGSLSPDQIEHCQSLQTMFQKQTLLLFKILTSTKTHQRNPYLVQLLLRIDFNKYFSSSGQQLGGDVGGNCLP
ncbi:gamma-tubulin complex component 4-like isoform X2 [Watersipora subatra]